MVYQWPCLFLQVVGVGYADATLRKFQVSEFTDNDQFSNLEASIFTVVILLRQIGSCHLFGVKVNFSSCSISSFNHR